MWALSCRAAAGSVRRSIRRLRQAVEPVRVFRNWPTYFRALGRRDDGQSVLLTRSGVRIAIRHNTWDIVIVREQFIDRSYLRYFRPRAARAPVVVDVGSYIGDFALYCASELGSRVLAYEPTAENYSVLQRNLELNPGIASRITAVHKGIAHTAQAVATVQIDGSEVHVSSYLYGDDLQSERRLFPCDTLAEALDRDGFQTVDLLKVDCEGAEYDIFTSTPRAVYDRIGGLVFEYHRVSDWEARLEAVNARLASAGFTLAREGSLIHAFRT